jgi:hypothetical protein
MAETLSTLGVPLRLANDDRGVYRRSDTRFFLFSQEVGHLVVQEPAKEKPGAEAASVVTTEISPTERGTTPARPRVQRVSTRHDDRYILLKKFEGFVISRGERSFTARLFENSSDYPVVEAEFDLEEISETDRELAIEGAALVWTIGYGYDGSTRKRESTIYLRRLPPWSEKEIAQARQAASELSRGIQWE